MLRYRSRSSNRETFKGVAGLLLNDISKCRDEFQKSTNKIDEEQFVQCVFKALKDELVLSDNSATPRKKWICSKIFKILWISMLLLLGFCLIAVGFKPVAFLVHKALHDRLYYILRPVRLAMVGIIPVLEKVGMDFLNTDCILENPYLTYPDGCPCFRIKYPNEVVLNYSSLPSYMTQSSVFDVHIVRNVSRFDSDFSIMKFIQFPSMNDGMYPLSCHEMSGENRGMYRYDEFFQQQRIIELLNNEKAWSFSWEECPNTKNPLTLHSLIPPLLPSLDSTSNATFTISTKWGTFTHFSECFPTGAVVVARVLLGEARFMMEPKTDECFFTCTTFRENPILQQGDALLFDQRVWNYLGISWSDVTFISVQLVSNG